MLNNLLIFLGAFVLSFASVFVLRPIAQNFGLVDRPCSRKQHKGNIPLVGGLAIYVAVILCSFLLTPFDAHYRLYLISTSFMVLIGALDDFYDIEASLRLIAQFLIGCLMVFGADLYIGDLGDLFGLGAVQLGMYWGPLFTLLAVVTSINAFNMTDGVDGLVGVLSLNTFVSIGVLAAFSNIGIDTDLMAMMAGAILAFLFFNFGSFKQGRYKVFMGDAGSMLLGLTVIWLLTFAVTRDAKTFNPITAVWLIAIPLMDMFSVMIRRIRAGYSPLRASRDHLHHILLANGLSAKNTTMTIGLAAATFSSIGIALEIAGLPESLSVVLFVGMFVAYNTIMTRQDTVLKTR